MVHKLTPQELDLLMSCKKTHKTLATLFACEACCVILNENRSRRSRRRIIGGHKMEYIETPVNKSHIKALKKFNTDINKLSTFTIISHVYKRHEIGILYLALILTYTSILGHWIGVI